MHLPLGALASMIGAPEEPLDPELAAPPELAPELLAVPELLPLPELDVADDDELPPAPPLLPPFAPLLLAELDEPPSPGVAPSFGELELLLHPAAAITKPAKVPSESEATNVDRRMRVLLVKWAREREPMAQAF